jgi:hypothetical protein
MISNEELRKYRQPCPEFVKFRELLDKAGIPWSDASEVKPYYIMHRTLGDGFSVIYGHGSYGSDEGLLELSYIGEDDVIGHLTAEEVFQIINPKKPVNYIRNYLR